MSEEFKIDNRTLLASDGETEWDGKPVVKFEGDAVTVRATDLADRETPVVLMLRAATYLVQAATGLMK